MPSLIAKQGVLFSSPQNDQAFKDPAENIAYTVFLMFKQNINL